VLLEHVSLVAAQEGWRQLGTQRGGCGCAHVPLSRAGVARRAPRHRLLVALPEGARVAQQAWSHEVGQRPELAQVVLHGRAGEDEAPLRRQAAQARHQLHVGVLELVPFVAHHPVPAQAGRLGIPLRITAGPASLALPAALTTLRCDLATAQRARVVQHHAVAGEQHATRAMEASQGGCAPAAAVHVHARAHPAGAQLPAKVSKGCHA